ncbi:MAG: hypothetical protein IKW58_03325 [Alphaproteobacteria bacterium]|nr:hypothetical protein [Alphaproteobacteria bacterium]
MTKYIEYFQVEAKCLLKDFKKNLPEAKSRCEKYFNGRDSLSLMNAQHVIAKEYGFDSWNDLIKQEPHKLAEALIVTKNKTFNSPFKLWHGGCITTGYEQNLYKLHKPEDYQLEYNPKTKNFFPRNSASAGGRGEYVSFEHLDVSSYDLSGIDPLKVRYSEDTKWPEDSTKLPQGFNPKEFLESRKNPGLGIKTLHKLGIKGQERNVVVIDPFRLFNHIEYHNSLKGYEEIGFDTINYNYSGGSNGGFISSLVGKTCGIVPSANLYYYAVNDVDDTKSMTQDNFVIAIQKAIELHKKLISEGKSGIDVIHIQRGISSDLFKHEKGHEKVLEVKQEVEKLGIWFSNGVTNNYPENKMLRIERIFCKLAGDVENPSDYELTEYSPLHKVPHTQKELFVNSLCFPGGARTVALEVKMDEYAFNHCAGSFAQTFMIGVFILAKSIKESLTPYEFFEQGIKTGTFKEGVGTIVNPVALIESLK